MDSNTAASNIADAILPGKYDNSENKDRDMSNVKFSDVTQLQQSIIGPIKPLSDKDYDMMYNTL